MVINNKVWNSGFKGSRNRKRFEVERTQINKTGKEKNTKNNADALWKATKQARHNYFLTFSEQGKHAGVISCLKPVHKKLLDSFLMKKEKKRKKKNDRKVMEKPKKR